MRIFDMLDPDMLYNPVVWAACIAVALMATGLGIITSELKGNIKIWGFWFFVLGIIIDVGVVVYLLY